MPGREVIDEIRKSGLRGRGGAGYPTGLKWGIVRKAEDASRSTSSATPTRAIPGAFMDRSVLEGDPHRVLEGMAIAGYAVGANQGYIYVRGEYPLAIERLQTGDQAGRNGSGCSGTSIFESPFNFRIDLRIGAGAFVCGEETALIRLDRRASAGAPRPRPPYPAERGLWGMPTADQQRRDLRQHRRPSSRTGARGSPGSAPPKSKGTKVFALAGKIQQHRADRSADGHRRCGTIIFDIGGGTPEGTEFKAVQTGGPSGGCIPNEHLDTPGRLRIARNRRLDHGKRRADRHGLDIQHGRRRAVLHGVLHGRVVRQVHPLPRRHGADPRAAGKDLARRGDARRPRTAGRALRDGEGDQPVRTGPVGPDPGDCPPCGSSAENTRSHAAIRRGIPSRAATPRPMRARSQDSPMAIVTLTINGQQVSAQGRGIAPRDRAAARHSHPHALPSRRLVRCGRVPAVPRRDRRIHQTPAGVRNETGGRYGGADGHRPAPPSTAG